MPHRQKHSLPVHASNFHSHPEVFEVQKGCTLPPHASSMSLSVCSVNVQLHLGSSLRLSKMEIYLLAIRSVPMGVLESIPSNTEGPQYSVKCNSDGKSPAGLDLSQVWSHHESLLKLP